jgi:hypothetical protein
MIKLADEANIRPGHLRPRLSSTSTGSEPKDVAQVESSKASKVGTQMVEMAFNLRKGVNNYRHDNKFSTKFGDKKLIKILQLTEQNSSMFEVPFQLVLLEPVHKLVEKYSGSLTCKVPHIKDEQLKKAWLKREELLDLMLDPEKYNSELFTLVIDTYMWYMSDLDLFSYLVAKYCAIPININYEEKKVFIEKHLSKVRLKILLFLAEWYKKYRDLVLMVESVEDIFAEALLIMLMYTDDKSWIKDKIKMLMGYSEREKFIANIKDRINDLTTRDNKINENLVKLNQEINDDKLEKYEVFFTLLKNESRKLAEQICLFDFDNFQLLLPNELLTTNWSQDKKKEVAPNVMYISEAFNRLSRLLTLHIMLSKDSKEIVRRTDDVIQLSDNLKFLNNFSSAYAVHLSISNVWLRNLMETAKITISSRAREAYEKQCATFSISQGQYRLQQAQFKAAYPTIPFLGLYIQQILMVCERKSTTDKFGRINLDKFWDLEEILKKIITTRNYPYEACRPNQKIQALLRSLPPTKKTEQYIEERFDKLIAKYQR